jgi:ribosomal protein S18 acetylase RimI-like enzyme
VPDIRLRPMSASEFAAMRARLVREYAAEQVQTGNWSADEAERRASERTDELLPEGVETPGMLMLTADTTNGDLVGHVWLALERQLGSGSRAWIYDIEVLPERRGRGFGRALLDAAESAALKNAATSVGLNVFGSNVVARHLYETSGYEVASIYMTKDLSTRSGSDETHTQ